MLHPVNTRNVQRIVSEPCRKYGVSRLDLFGSRARGEARPESDYDFVVEFDDLKVSDASERYFGLLHALADLLDGEVDLLTYDALSRDSLKRKIQRERLPVYEARA